MTLLPGDCIISAGMISYSGAFTSHYREKMEHEWREKLKTSGLAYSEGINMRNFLGEPVKIQAWNIAELPKDDTST
jgi:dynein heavy chain, axonemal